ncbi:MAG: metallophosphoesterase [Roseburia sp.]|nr:metallophosphoesterase [Roseburia sp.]
MSKVRWLHFSDLHKNVDSVETKVMREKLLSYLAGKEIFCDYVFFSGDLRNAPDGEFPEDTTEYLKKIVEIVGVTPENTFIVPGNHDVVRDDKERMAAIKRMHFNGVVKDNGYYNSSEGKIRDEDIYAISRGKEAFVEVMKDFYGEDSERVKCYSDSGQPHFLISTEDFDVYHVDSTISYAKGQERDLILGMEYIYNLIKERNNDKITVILTHYSYDFLTRDEQSMLLTIMGGERKFLWLAGHEHNELIRIQRDAFYELQAGNLLKETGTKSCVLYGEIDTCTGEGIVKGYCWFSADGWAEYPIMNKKTGSNEYPISLGEHDDFERQIKKIVDKAYEDEEGTTYILNLGNLNENVLKDIPEEGLDEIKRQLGDRLVGTESKKEVISLFLAEVQMSMNSNRRYECMPMFQDVVRGVYEGYIYVDNEVAATDKVQITHFFIDWQDKFIVKGEHYWYEIITVGGEPAFITNRYDLSPMQNVEERLYAFRKIEKLVKANRIFVRMIGHEEYNLTVDCLRFLHNSDEWEMNIDMTMFWIDEMQKVSKIQSWFGIQFKLPRKASDEEHVAIQILSDAIDRKSCCTLPGIPDKMVVLKKRFQIEHEMELDVLIDLPNLELFGYVFRPIKQYLTPEQYKWNSSKKVWESKYGGVALGVEFEVETSKADVI